MTLELGGGRRLVLAVGDEGWLWLAAGAAAVALLLGLYRYERRLVPLGIGRLLLALRVAAAVALVVALMEPIARRSWTDRVEGRLIVGVDLSASMDTGDARRPADERDRLRDAPGLASPSGGDDPTRRAIASRILRGGAMAELDRGLDVEAIGFARSVAPGGIADLAAMLDRGDATGLDPADRLATDWGPVLDRAIEDDPAAPVLGVVLLTDGRRNAPAGGDGAGGGDAADRLARAGVPVFPVLVGATVPPRDAAIAAIRAPESAFVGDSASVLVEVKADGFEAGAEIPVTLEVPGAGTLREVVRAGEDGDRPVASFRVPMEQPGALELVAAVEPPGDEDERPDNDRRSAAVRVGDEEARVLLVDAEARWEFRYLHNALARDRRVALDAVLLAPPPPSAGSEPTFAAELPPAPKPGSNEPDPINSYDVIILGDVPPGLASSDLWGRLDAFVSERGGTLVLAAGPRGWPDDWREDESALALLPVRDPVVVPVDGPAVDPGRAALPTGVAVVPDDEAAAMLDDWPMLQFAADPEASRDAWEGLAPLTWVLAGRAKPGATALLVVDRPASNELDVVAAAQPFGMGKVLWVGTDGTWRWRLRVGDAYHHRFWGQVIRWAASSPTASGNRLVRFGPDRPRVDAGLPAPLRARFADDAPGIGPDLLAAAWIYKAPDPVDGPSDDNGMDPDVAGQGSAADRPSSPGRGEPIALVPMQPSPDLPRTFEATTPLLSPGRYVAVLDVPALADAFAAEGLSPPEATFEVAPPDTDELIALAADPAPLDRLASATGGRVLRDFEAGLLPGLIAPRPVERTRTAETPLWDTPLGLAVFFGLMAAEWVVRKRAGLP